MDKPTYIALTADIADKMVNLAMSQNGEQVYEMAANGDERYTFSAQILFNLYLDDICKIFADNGIEGDD